MSEGGDAVPFEQMQPIDQYILARTAELTGKIRKAYDDFEFHRVYHLLNEFCNSELSAFYLDVLKDRLYTYPIEFKPGHDYQRDLYLARRSAQTAIYKITDALARLTAPILSFTADEVYQSLPHTSGSVHLTLFPTPESLAPPTESRSLIADWDSLFAATRRMSSRKLENLRDKKIIGKSLEAVVTLYIGETEKKSGEEVRGFPARTLQRFRSRFSDCPHERPGWRCRILRWSAPSAPNATAAGATSPT